MDSTQLARVAPAITLEIPANIRLLLNLIEQMDARALAQHPSPLVRPMIPGEFWPYAVANCRHVVVSLTPHGHIGKVPLPYKGRPPRFILADMAHMEALVRALDAPSNCPFPFFPDGGIFDMDEYPLTGEWNPWFEPTADDVLAYNAAHPEIFSADSHALGAALTMWREAATSLALGHATEELRRRLFTADTGAPLYYAAPVTKGVR